MEIRLKPFELLDVDEVFTPGIKELKVLIELTVVVTLVVIIEVADELDGKFKLELGVLLCVRFDREEDDSGNEISVVFIVYAGGSVTLDEEPVGLSGEVNATDVILAKDSVKELCSPLGELEPEIGGLEVSDSDTKEEGDTLLGINEVASEEELVEGTPVGEVD
ncbi:hypothetical protein P153DRAFT_380484 [Dothidotthia symphoricarpi CBS 119687]|uniref:Uncharacterized protein n=1 Tax=Dothidotthia symphoricarpi CBS 119687 TaxID=1392245 RepID=A0A6A6AS96_9PLEO|nr:uncharacterized protein P153DRAFT_380484 [Dothidotthia symphoricarpi CBS 119687]KAF2134670.1 hypothetical protein P153DRAFT_380484 [Dothidotthia symphoricarpi CBS 119687]